MREPETRFSVESPGGIISVVAFCKSGKVDKVTLQSMPSFVAFNNKKVNNRWNGLTHRYLMKIDYSLGQFSLPN